MLCRWLQEPLATEVLGVVTMVNLRAPFAPPSVSATDASGTTLAGGRAVSDPKVRQELSSHCLRKGIRSKPLPPGKGLAATTCDACGGGAGA